jgi:hypothetical protein
MLTVLMCFCLWSGYPDKDNAIAENQQTQRGGKEHSAPSGNSVSQNAVPCIICQNQAPQNTGDSKPLWQKPEWLNIGLTATYTVLTVGALIAVYRQNRSIQRIERAILIPVWENMVHLNPESKKGPSHSFEWNFVNCGKTPAFIDEIVGHMILVDSIDALPPNPKYGKPVPYLGDPIIHQEKMKNERYSPMKDEREFSIIEAEYRSGKKVLFAYGFVRYRDIFDRKHETRFGLQYKAWPEFNHEYDGFVVGGPKKYNRFK